MGEWPTLDALGAILASKGPEKRPSRLELLRDALMPSYLRDTPSSPQADLALANPNALPGKIGPPSGPPTTLDKIGGFAADAAGWLAPELKSAVAMKAIFGGPLAKTADLAALARAKKLAEAGTTSKEIWNNTGWFQGADKKWRFEIPDTAASARQRSMGEINMPETRPATLGAALDYPELYAAYPEAAKMKFGVFDNTYEQPTSKVPGGLTNLPLRKGAQLTQSIGSDLQLQPAMMIGDLNYVEKGSNKPANVMLHELQHYIQEKEGFAPGTHPDAAGSFQNYQRAAGEVEARNVQARQRMTPDERRMFAPWTTEDVPRKQQIIRYLGDLGK